MLKKGNWKSLLNGWMKECYKNIDNGGDFYEKEIIVWFVFGLLKLSF